MIGCETKKTARRGKRIYPVIAAERFIHLFESLKTPTEAQHADLAAAYYTLANEEDLSFSKSNLYLNSAIALLKKIPVEHRHPHWSSQIARAYFKRAELLEEKNNFTGACFDYQQAMQALEYRENVRRLNDEERSLLAQCTIAIADLIVHEEIDNDGKLFHPLFYINQSLENLALIAKPNDDIFAAHATAHQIAGIVLSEDHFEEAVNAFKMSLLMAFKTETIQIYPLLADIYTCLGLLYEQQYQRCAIEKPSHALADHAMIYFGLSCLFNPNEAEENSDDGFALQSLFETIYRVLDPYQCPLSYQVVADLVDALIYIYVCIIDGCFLPPALEKELNQPQILDVYLQHLYWLVAEAYRKTARRVDTFDILGTSAMSVRLDRSDILTLIENPKSDNVCYLPRASIVEDGTHPVKRF